jgi:hypothetical protein
LQENIVREILIVRNKLFWLSEKKFLFRPKMSDEKNGCKTEENKTPAE